MSFLPPPTSSHLLPSAYPHTHKNPSVPKNGQKATVLWTLGSQASRPPVYYCVAAEVTFFSACCCSHPPTGLSSGDKERAGSCCPAHWVLLSLLTDSQADGCFLCSAVYQTLITLSKRSPKGLNSRQVRSKQVLALKLTRYAPENEFLYSLIPVVSLLQ